MGDIKRLDIVDIELNSGNLHRSWLNHSIGSGDNNANGFGVRLFRNGEPVNIGAGWVQGFFRNSQGENIALTEHGAIAGNEAYVVLPQACYNYDGPFTLAIKLVSEGSTNTVTMRIVDGMVDNTNTGSAVAPTGTVPTYQEILAVYAEMQEDIADYESVVATQNGKIDDLKSAFGYNRYTLSTASNKELCKIYPVYGHTYFILGKMNSYVTGIDFYEFYTGGTNSKVNGVTSGTEFNYMYTPSSANVSYLRIYVKVSGGTGAAECIAYDCNSSSADLVELMNRMHVSAYGTNALLQADYLMGFSSVLDLPPNKIFAISHNIDSSTIFPGLPEYGVLASIVSFSPRTSYSDNRNAVYFYSTNNLDTYIGFRTTTTINWKKINNDFDYLFGNPKILNKSFSSNTELTKLYPDTGKKYDILIYNATNTASITMYEFDTNGDYQVLQTFKSYNMPFAFHYEPSENADYLRIYMKPETGETASVEACILESENILSPFIITADDDAMDYLLSKEFAAVRKFTVIGDSLASGYYKESASGTQHSRNIDYSWPQIMARMYGQTAVNATQSGATTASWWEDASGYCKAMVTSNTRSQVYIMALGTNDYKDVADADITQEQIDTFISNYCRILEYVHQVAPDAKIICCTIPQPRPNTTWKQEAIRGICEDSDYTDFVCLCDLIEDYNGLSNSKAMQSEMWQSHFTPVGYANSASFLMYAFSKTIRANRSMFINLPLIPFDPVS